MHRRSVHPGPLVLGAASLSSLAPAEDRDRTVSRRSEPSSRTALNGEQPYPWDLLVDVDSWARSACYPRSTFYPLSDGRTATCRRITRACFRTCSTRGSRSQARLCPCTQKGGCRPPRAYLRAPPLLFGRRPPQSNCPPGTVPRPGSGRGVRTPVRRGQYSKVASRRAGARRSPAPAYPLRSEPAANAKLQ